MIERGEMGRMVIKVRTSPMMRFTSLYDGDLCAVERNASLTMGPDLNKKKTTGIIQNLFLHAPDCGAPDGDNTPWSFSADSFHRKPSYLSPKSLSRCCWQTRCRMSKHPFRKSEARRNGTRGAFTACFPPVRFPGRRFSFDATAEGPTKKT